MKRKIGLFALALACVVLAGCGSKPNQPAKTAREIEILVIIDRSASINSYDDGGLKGIQRDYMCVCQGYMKKILQLRDGVHVEARAFVRDEVILFSVTVNKWEQVRSSIKKEIDAAPYKKVDANKTLFSSLLFNVHDLCKKQQNKDFYVLVLTDGHPDESFKQIKAAALKFASDDPGNLKSLLIAPVQPDMKHRWREKLAESLSPLGESTEVANAQDYCVAAAKSIKTLEGVR
jgi:hypothetical protein